MYLMRWVKFFKYSATKNDFVILEGEKITRRDVSNICDRRIGAGSDGLFNIIEVEDAEIPRIFFDFFNNDGGKTSFCGNGARVLGLHFKITRNLDIIKLSYDGKEYEVRTLEFWQDELGGNFTVAFPLDFLPIELDDSSFFVDSGSPHVVVVKKKLDDFETLRNEALQRRKVSEEKVANVTFIVPDERRGHIMVLTYERGVEDFTPSCGTGAVAAALVWKLKKRDEMLEKIKILTDGGELMVTFPGGALEKCFLTGEASFSFKGELLLKH